MKHLDFFRRVLEGLFINLIWWVLQTIIIIVPVISVVSFPNVFTNKFLILIIILLALGVSLVLWKFGGRYLPPLRWNIIHECNTYTLEYKTRETAYYEKRIVAIPLRNHIEAFEDGEYRWSGSSSEISILESADFDLSVHDTQDRTKYTVRPKAIVRAYKLLPYTLAINLCDDNKSAIPSNYIYIKRPTKKIVLIVKMAVGVPICNVRYIAKTKYGEENKLIYKKGSLTQENGYNVYTFTIRRPKMLCEYEIRWDWC